MRPLLAAAVLVSSTAGAQPDQPTIFVPHYYSLGATVATFVINPDDFNAWIINYNAGC